ncbi:MAG: HEPN domain-containing protein [Desulfurococcales archaeon]|nr:HEPN domain-containing protein [Desulfurococcales archaeon]
MPVGTEAGSIADDEESREYVVRLLERRARNALARAERSLEHGDYDGAVFDAEQAVQLYLESVILEHTGATPHTHNIRRLLHVVGRLLGFADEVREFVARNRFKLHTLEDAYYSSRYLPKEFTREDASELVGLAREVIGLVESRRARRPTGKED